MAEKGGKGFSLSAKQAKSSPKPSSTNGKAAKGKDDSSGKSKKGRKVQFESSEGLGDAAAFSFSSGGKADGIFSKLNLGKGGKADKTGSAAKSSTPKEPSPLELRVEQELPTNAKCLMDCEAAQILQGIQEQMVMLSEDPSIKLPVSFDRGFQYAKKGNHYADPESARKVLENLKKHGVNDGEICVIANICPDSADEVFALVPSLKAKKSVLVDPLKEVLGELTKLKQAI